MTPERVVIITGPTASGKTTIAKRIAEKYNLRYVSGGYAFQKVIDEKGGADWWEKDGLKFIKDRMTNPSLDLEVDKKMRSEGEKGNIVLDSRTMPWLLDFGFKVWVGASLEVRAQRLTGRNNMSYDAALRSIEVKDDETNQIYSKMYNFEVKPDPKVFDLIVNTDNMSPNEVFDFVDSSISSYLGSSGSPREN